MGRQPCLLLPVSQDVDADLRRHDGERRRGAGNGEPNEVESVHSPPLAGRGEGGGGATNGSDLVSGGLFRCTRRRDGRRCGGGGGAVRWWVLVDRAGHRDEEHTHVALRVDLALRVLGVDVKHLATLEWLTDRNDHAAAWLDLLEQIGRRVLRGAGDDDDVEAAFHLGPAVVAV